MRAKEELHRLEQALGRPMEVEFPQPFAMREGEFRLLCRSMSDGRSSDVTLFILIAGQIVAIRKPFHPPGVYRPPSGGIRPGEGIEEAAKREGLEETGLLIELDSYLLKLKPTFVRGGIQIGWTSHVFLAQKVGGKLQPRDTWEIEEARLVSISELEGSIRERLLSSGLGGLGYRAQLADLALARLRKLRII